VRTGQDGYPATMSDNSDLRNDDQANEAVQAVVDRVLSWQGGAPVDTVRTELENGLAEVGETMPADWVESTAARISDADPAQK
jgi:hypothetical protein